MSVFKGIRCNTQLLADITRALQDYSAENGTQRIPRSKAGNIIAKVCREAGLGTPPVRSTGQVLKQLHRHNFIWKIWRTPGGKYLSIEPFSPNRFSQILEEQTETINKEHQETERRNSLVNQLHEIKTQLHKELDKVDGFITALTDLQEYIKVVNELADN